MPAPPSSVEHFTNLSPLVGHPAHQLAPPAGRYTGFSQPATSVSLAHDYLLVMRGAERTFAAIADLYPQAPIFTLLYDEQGTNGRFADRSITTSPLQRLGVGQSSVQAAAAALPAQPSSGCARRRATWCSAAAAPSPTACASRRAPCTSATATRRSATRGTRKRAPSARRPPLLRPLLRRQLRRIRRWDLAASRRVDSYVAISELSRERIKRYYGRDALVIHPPVETHRFAPASRGDALLVVSEFVRHKRLHVALEAARRARVADPRRRRGARPHARCARPTRRPSSSGASATRISSSCTRAPARCSCRAWRSSASPPSRPRRPAGR